MGDDLTKTPWLTALKANGGTRTVSLKISYLPSPTRESFKANPDMCSDGFECIADEWILNRPDAKGIYTNLRFAGFNGKWEPFGDAAPEGWHVYWKGNAGLYHPIELDLVPLVERSKQTLYEMES